MSTPEQVQAQLDELDKQLDKVKGKSITAAELIKALSLQPPESKVMFLTYDDENMDGTANDITNIITEKEGYIFLVDPYLYRDSLAYGKSFDINENEWFSIDQSLPIVRT